jgi:hypothetical protein
VATTDQTLQGGTGSGGAADIGQAKEQAIEKAEEVKARASDRARSELDRRSTQLGEQVASLARALRKGAEHLATEGNQTGATSAHKAADQAERLGSYLTNSNADGFLSDLERFGRQRPWATGAIGAALGFVGARFFKASSENRYRNASAVAYTSRRDADLPMRRERETTGNPSQGSF